MALPPQAVLLHNPQFLQSRAVFGYQNHPFNDTLSFFWHTQLLRPIVQTDQGNYYYLDIEGFDNYRISYQQIIDLFAYDMTNITHNDANDLALPVYLPRDFQVIIQTDAYLEYLDSLYPAEAEGEGQPEGQAEGQAEGEGQGQGEGEGEGSVQNG